MPRKITLKQIAKELDVSVSTVSKSLKDSPEISLDTKEKVKAFAKLYNYKPNNIALSLKNRKTKTIGIIIPEIVHHFFTTVIQGIEHVANEKGYNVIICLSNNSFDKEVLNLEFLANGSTDGFIMSIAKETQQKEDYHHIKEVINQGMPVVMFDRVIDEVICDKVVISDKHGAFEAVQYLIDHHCKKIAIISTVDYVSVGKLRTEGYKDALITNDMEIDQDLILKIEDVDHSEEKIEEFLKNKNVDGIFAVNEQFAVNAIKVLKKLHKKVPEDVSVIGFTDGVVSKSFIPSLSTVNQHGEEMGAKAANLLIDRLENEAEEQSFQTTVLDTSLIIRDSVKK
ncbi:MULTISPECIES: LacI family DNA-binding transcriptional regulator [Mesonia]|uniref:HTH-type transcriptional regulator DegA n=1 Tax=Mesonia oceanica TaxID=2687242 RepID=A0AC61Y948_9FLAO|nr:MULTISPECIES: LacI family DNA-binding transcriptional regulator [Mesonia]MAN25867.1 LacI family transcriptional regulator [Mesonia sp.]MAN27514.1 LacI family transcriptional regulator [Mesonia sp.]MAQ40595.1 LacI family transcriptional regulator [Mesonia sp.]VVV01022.1 HTH-type transcriptional regulator DegA [Mesonia oceanica]|tara:strand:- start:14824 stop:15843 length:1020 start_codon:yes stop_codon:yes gene_type:complete